MLKLNSTQGAILNRVWSQPEVLTSRLYDAVSKDVRGLSPQTFLRDLVQLRHHGLLSSKAAHDPNLLRRGKRHTYRWDLTAEGVIALELYELDRLPE